MNKNYIKYCMNITHLQTELESTFCVCVCTNQLKRRQHVSTGLCVFHAFDERCERSSHPHSTKRMHNLISVIMNVKNHTILLDRIRPNTFTSINQSTGKLT